jgi:hypothetical protein
LISQIAVGYSIERGIAMEYNIVQIIAYMWAWAVLGVILYGLSLAALGIKFPSFWTVVFATPLWMVTLYMFSFPIPEIDKAIWIFGSAASGIATWDALLRGKNNRGLPKT